MTTKNSLPDNLDTPANRVFLEQVVRDLVHEDREPTEENIRKAIQERLERNQRIAESADALEEIRQAVA